MLVTAFNNLGGTSQDAFIGLISVDDKKLTVFGNKKWDNVYDVHWLQDGSGFILTGKEKDDSTLHIWRATYPEGTV